MISDVKKILRKDEFRVTCRKCNDGTYKIALHGNKMIERWGKLIRSSHPRKSARIESIIKIYHDRTKVHAAVAQWESTPGSFS